MRSLNLLKPARKGCSRREANKIHFQRRFLERVGYSLSDEKYNQLKNSIVPHGQYLYQAGNGSCYLINFEGIQLKVIYNPFQDTLITILSR